MNIGDVITVKAHKADGMCYQWWQATVAAVSDEALVVMMPKGTTVTDIRKGVVRIGYDDRGTYRFDTLYTYIESFNAAGALVEIYMDISSLPRIVGDELHYTDYELDVTRVLPNAAEIIDEDEFAEAVVTYGYTEEFQAQCYRVAREALAVANACG